MNAISLFLHKLALAFAVVSLDVLFLLELALGQTVVKASHRQLIRFIQLTGVLAGVWAEVRVVTWVLRESQGYS